MIANGSPIPAILVADADGHVRPLAVHLDRPTVVVFFKRSCETSQLALPVFQQWSRLEPGVGLLGISQDTPAETAEFFEELDLDMPLVFDNPPYEASRAFDIDAVPAWLLVDEGEVVWAWVGWSTERTVELTGMLTARTGTDLALQGMDDRPPFRPG